MLAALIVVTLIHCFGRLVWRFHLHDGITANAPTFMMKTPDRLLSVREHMRENVGGYHSIGDPDAFFFINIAAMVIESLLYAITRWLVVPLIGFPPVRYLHRTGVSLYFNT